MRALTASPPAAAFDTTRRFVRWHGEGANGFVAFDFAIGAPEVFVEMILPAGAYAEFCATHQVELLPPAAATAEPDDWAWRLADATATRFK